nr:MAG TPA: Preprotein translocase subunit [Caudoviricetes sp.]
MNYEFHVGDYVKTRAGFIGYIESVHDLLHGTTGLYVRFVDGDCHCFEVTNKTISSNFLRIGAYDFTKKEKKKIEPISDCNKHIFSNAIKPDNQLVRTVSDNILNKINELVDAVNKLMDKEDEE